MPKIKPKSIKDCFSQEKKSIEWTSEKLTRFKEAHAEACRQNADVFVFDGDSFLPAYAGYLIEFLRTIFPDECEDCNGSGRIFRMTNHEDVSEGYSERCSSCNGTGSIKDPNAHLGANRE